MSRLSFQTFCIEFYSHHIQKNSSEVYDLFEKEGVLDLLDREYDDLHGMGMEYMMQFIDEYLGNEKVRK
jgi:transcription termination factor Rho